MKPAPTPRRMASAAVTSRGEDRRLIQQDAVELDGEKLGDPVAALDARSGVILKVGRKNFFRLQ